MPGPKVNHNGFILGRQTQSFYAQRVRHGVILMDNRRLSRLTLSLLLSVLAVLSLIAINEVGFRRSSQALA